MFVWSGLWVALGRSALNVAQAMAEVDAAGVALISKQPGWTARTIPA
jgi:hypothetical protein